MFEDAEMRLEAQFIELQNQLNQRQMVLQHHLSALRTKKRFVCVSLSFVLLSSLFCEYSVNQVSDLVAHLNSQATRQGDGWRSAEAILARSSIFDLFDLKPFLEKSLQVRVCYLCLLHTPIHVLNTQDTAALEVPATRSVLTERPFTVDFAMNTKKVFESIGSVDSDSSNAQVHSPLKVCTCCLCSLST